MPQYRVRPGFYFGGIIEYGPGTIIELTDAEAQGFLDKLERLPDAPTDAPTDALADAPKDTSAEVSDAPAGDQPAENGEPAKGKKRNSKGQAWSV